MKDEYKSLPWERVVSLEALKATVEPFMATAPVINKPGRNLRSRSACFWCVCACRIRWARPSKVRLIRPRPPSLITAAAALRNHHPETAHPCCARQVAAPDRSVVPLAPLSVRSSFCVVTFTIAVQEAPGPEDRPPAPARPPIPKRQSTLPPVRRPDPVGPRLCAHLPLVYRSVRRVRTRDCPAVHCVKARPSHRRSIACAALRSLAGAFRRAQHIRRRCATPTRAG